MTTTILALTEKEDPDGDENVVVDVPTGPVTRRMTVGNILKRPHGQIHTFAGAGTQTLNATPLTWERVTQFTTDGLGSNVTRIAASHKLVPLKALRYLVKFNVAFVGTYGATYYFAAYWNGVQQSQVADEDIAGDFSRARVSASGVVDVTSTSLDLELWVASDKVSPVLQVKKASLLCHAIF